MAKSMALGRGLGELLGEVENAYENENTSSDNCLKKLNLN